MSDVLLDSDYPRLGLGYEDRNVALLAKWKRRQQSDGSPAFELCLGDKILGRVFSTSVGLPENPRRFHAAIDNPPTHSYPGDWESDPSVCMKTIENTFGKTLAFNIYKASQEAGAIDCITEEALMLVHGMDMDKEGEF